MQNNVLIIGYNRPNMLKQRVGEWFDLNAKIYVSLDVSPDENNKDSLECRTLAQELYDQGIINFPNIAPQNLGCRYGVKSAIDWFYSNVQEGFIIEDDVSLLRQPDIDCLDRSKVHALFTSFRASHSYETIHGSVWGWYAHADIWNDFSRSFETLHKPDWLWLLKNASFYTFCDSLRVFLYLANNNVDTWDLNWRLYRMKNKIWTRHPGRTIVENVGFQLGTHYTENSAKRYRKSSKLELELPIGAKSIDILRVRNRFTWKHQIKEYLKVTYEIISYWFRRRY